MQALIENTGWGRPSCVIDHDPSGELATMATIINGAFCVRIQAQDLIRLGKDTEIKVKELENIGVETA